MQNSDSLMQESASVSSHFFQRFDRFCTEGNIPEALFSLIQALCNDPSKIDVNYSTFFVLLDKWCQVEYQTSSDQGKGVLNILQVAKDLYPDTVDLNYLLAKYLYRFGNYRESWQYAFKAISVDKYDPCIRTLYENICNALIERWHIPMLNDQSRNMCYKKAITKCVSEGYKNVLDIGSGTGILSGYAEQAGAEVNACETSPIMIELSEEVLKTNDLKNIKLHNVHSKELHIGEHIEKCSLGITETVDAGLFGEDILGSLQDAWERLLLNCDNESSSKAKILPSSAELYISVIECSYFAKQTKLLLHNELFKSYSLILNQNEPYLSEKLQKVPGGFKYLSKWIKIDSINFNSLEDISQHLMKNEKIFELNCCESGRPDAIAVAFILHLEDEKIHTFPEYETCWQNALFPIKYPDLNVNDIISVKYTSGDPINISLVQHDFVSKQLKLDTDVFMVLNNEFYMDFFTQGSSAILPTLPEKELSVVCDLTPFPIAGIQTLQKVKYSVLYVANDTIKDILSKIGIVSCTIEELNLKIDILFVWPLSLDGSLFDEITNHLILYRDLMDSAGITFPEYMTLNMVGIESEELIKMTKVSNEYTCGIDVESINIFKTSHHLDIPLSTLDYKSLTNKLSLLRIYFKTGEVKSTPINCSDSGENHNLSMYNKLDLKTKKKEVIASDDKYMKCGGPVYEAIYKLKCKEEGSLSAFVYWFSLHGCITNQSVNDSSSSDPSTFVDFELNVFDKSPVTNQCALMENEPSIVSTKENYQLKVIWRDGSFTVHLNKNK